MGYHYPIDEMWSKDEIIIVVQFFTLIEKAYEGRVQRNEVLTAYNEFKGVVPSKSEEKQLFSQFESVSNYASYPVVQLARQSTLDYIKMNT